MTQKSLRIGIPQDKIEENELPSKKEEISNVQIPISHEPSPIFTVKVTYPSLRKRSEPCEGDNVVDVITDKGIYDIYAEDNGWGQLEDKNWIMLSLCNKINK